MTFYQEDLFEHGSKACSKENCTHLEEQILLACDRHPHAPTSARYSFARQEVLVFCAACQAEAHAAGQDLVKVAPVVGIAVAARPAILVVKAKANHKAGPAKPAPREPIGQAQEMKRGAQIKARKKKR